VHQFTPANVTGLPAGWEIDLYESGDYINLSLWRVRAMLKPYREDRSGDDTLIYSASRYDDAYLPEGYTQDEFHEALQELVWKATQFDGMVDEIESRFDNFWATDTSNRPSRSEYFHKGK
jgi:hypothetical protein